MNAQTTLIKCRCQNCNGHIQFESDQAGATVACPHCGIETLLFIPQSAPAQRIKAAAQLRPVPWRIILFTAMGVAMSVGIGLAVGKLATKAAKSGQLPEIGQGMFGILGLILFLIAFLIALLWLLFPVFMYFGMARQEKLLQQIERNTRP